MALDAEYCYAECRYAECRYAECRGALAVLHSKGRLLALPGKNYTRMKMTGIDRRTSLLCNGIVYLGKKFYSYAPRFLNRYSSSCLMERLQSLLNLIGLIIFYIANT
jgi:hypothetical protein